MERHRCKLCFKSFSNGRALGGHMRSHLLNLPIPVQLSEETEPASSPYSSSSDGEEEEVEDDQDQDQEGEEKGSGGFNYGLRENPKRSIRLVDPEFSVASVVLQDRESETESSKNLTRRRSKRTRKFLLDQTQHDHLQFHQSQEQEGINLVKKIKSFKAAESEPASSISDATTEEEVAFCLMMLSRDKWKIKEEEIKVLLQDEEEEEEEEEYEETEKSVEETGESGEINNKSNYKIINNVNRSRGGKYRCETCNRMFKSYQALGGHRASHKKLKIQTSISKEKTKLEAEHNNNAGAEKKTHQCPYCFRVFSSGQALGGHKRSHLIGVAPVPVAAAAAVAVAMSSYSTKLGAGETLNSNSSIDLNLPPPIDDDDLSQIELSAVSDAEFVNYIKR